MGSNRLSWSKIKQMFMRPKSHIRADIQALRALAVGAVVVYHIWPTRLIGGYMGVDVFFVISGYLMTLTIWKSVTNALSSMSQKNGSKGVLLRVLVDFYLRRIKRLAPAATLCLLLILATVFMIGNFSLQAQTAPQALASVLFLENWFLANQAVDYLGQDAGASAVQHFWSLSIEEQFYLIWPMLLIVAGVVAYRRFQGRVQDGKPREGVASTAPLFLICLFTLGSLAYGIFLTDIAAQAAYFVTPARIWELSLGGIIVFLPCLRGRFFRQLLPWAGIIPIICVMFMWDGSGFPGWKALVPTIGTGLVIWSGKMSGPASTDTVFTLLSRLRPAQFLGDISYSLYLYHWPLVVLSPFFLQDFGMPRRYVKIALFAAGILLAWLSYRLVESPFRHLKLERKREKLRVALVGIVCLTLIVVPSRLVEVRAIDLTENVVERALERAADPGDIYFGARATQHTAAGSSPYGKIDPEWAQFGSSFFGGRPFGINPYTNDISDDQPVSKAGELGAITSDKTILFIGDSYSEQWYSAIHIAACNPGFKVIAAASTTCGSGVFELDYDFGETWVFSDGSEKSVAKANERFNYIRNELWPKADIVIVAVSPAYYTGTNTNPENSPLAGTKLAQTLTALNETIGKKPILIQAIPIIAGFNEQTDQIYIDARDKRFADVTEYMDRVYTLLQKEGVADVVEYLRVDSLFLDDEGYAHTQIGGLPVYYNNGHINALYSASAGEYFTEELRRIIDDME